MKNYLLLIKGSFSEWNNLSQSERDKHIDQFGEFAKNLGEKGYIKGGDGCAERAFRVKKPELPDNECLVPPQTSDMVTGYFMIEVPSEEEALKVARQCPAFNCGEYVELVPCEH